MALISRWSESRDRSLWGSEEKLWFIFSDLIKFIAGELNLMDILPEWNEEKLIFFRPAEKLIAEVKLKNWVHQYLA